MHRWKMTRAQRDKLKYLEGEEHGGEGLEPDEPVQREGGGGVVGPVVERRDLIMLPTADNNKKIQY